MDCLRERGFKLAIGSSSKNTGFILSRLGLDHYFDVVVDGNDISKSKPDPEVFLLAAQRLGVPAERCLVVEDAEAGIRAAYAAKMGAAALGYAASLHIAETVSNVTTVHAALGAGISPIEDVLRLLSERGFQGNISIEEDSGNGEKGIFQAYRFVTGILTDLGVEWE